MYDNLIRFVKIHMYEMIETPIHKYCKKDMLKIVIISIFRCNVPLEIISWWHVRILDALSCDEGEVAEFAPHPNHHIVPTKETAKYAFHASTIIVDLFRNLDL